MLSTEPIDLGRSWPHLQGMLASGHLEFIDYLLAHTLLGEGCDDEAAAALLCHLSTAARSGHLCVRLSSDGIFPDPAVCWLSQELNPSEQKSSTCFAAIRSLILAGAAALPGALVTLCGEENCLQAPPPTTPLCRQQQRYYLQRYWLDESRCVANLIKLSSEKPTMFADAATLARYIAAEQRAGMLLPEQAEAIAYAAKNSLTFICGGPGTGKTHTAGQLIKLLWLSLPLEERDAFQIALAAPTGKAAMNLEGSLSRAILNLPGFPPVSAKTLHALLGIKAAAIGRSNAPARRLAADLILIDECSMIDARMMGQLMAAVKPGARLILLGDKHQLPSIEAGSIFADCLSALSQEGGGYVISLKKCLRTELQAIISFAACINAGDAPAAIAMLQAPQAAAAPYAPPPLSFTDLAEGALPIKIWQQRLLSYSGNNFCFDSDASDAAACDQAQVAALLPMLNKFRILTPFRQGPFGVDTLNSLFLKQMLAKSKKNRYFIAPIMLTANDWKRELFNGEIGLLVRRTPGIGEQHTPFTAEDFALFPGQNQSASGAAACWRRLPALLLPRFEYAYCMSVHKSQGSEFDHVVLLLPSGSELFGREVLYTGVTRAKRRLEIWSASATLSATITEASLRHSGIAERLQQLF